MYTIKKAEFMLCAAWTSQWPDESLPEVVMAGRSNVGKSSFINTVTNVQGLAKVSSTPGKTRTLNFFNINDELRQLLYTRFMNGESMELISKDYDFNNVTVSNHIRQYVKEHNLSDVYEAEKVRQKNLRQCK